MFAFYFFLCNFYFLSLRFGFEPSHDSCEMKAVLSDGIETYEKESWILGFLKDCSRKCGWLGYLYNHPSTFDRTRLD